MATTTPNYGWDVPTSTDYVKDGATAIETLGDDIDATLWTALGGAYPGLRLIKKQTIGSAVSSVTVTNAFSATYENYKILISGGSGSTVGSAFSLSLSGITTGYYQAGAFVSYGSTTVTGYNNTNTSSFTDCGQAGTNGNVMHVDLMGPFLTTRTMLLNSYAGLNVSTQGNYTLFFNGFNTNATSATGFTVTASTGTITGGTIYVYGYGAS